MLPEILKPSTEKIALAMLLFIVFVPFIIYDNGIRCVKAPCHSGQIGSVLAWLVFSYKLQIYSISYPILVSGAVASYLVACFAIYLTNPQRKVLWNKNKF